MRVPIATVAAACAALLSCAPHAERPPAPAGEAASGVAVAVAPEAVYTGRTLTLGRPLAVDADFSTRAVIADGSPGRIVRWNPATGEELEFQGPSSGGAGFYPTDVAVSGFFVYAVDETARRILRFDDRGAYRDVLLNFETLDLGRRVSPYSIAVDPSGRVAISDIENHQVLLFDSYLELELAFGQYGSYDGQLDDPRGVSFSPGGELVVADTGNRRVQVFSGGGTFVRAVPAPGEDNPLQRPERAVADDAGRIFVADALAGAVVVFAADGSVERLAAPAGASGFAPSDVARTRAGMVLVTDEAAGAVFVFKGI